MFVCGLNPPLGACRDGRRRRKHQLAFGQNLGKNMGKGSNGQFLADAAFVKWIRIKS